VKWREDLRTVTLPDGRQLIGASFRGVAFLVETVELSTGRRLVVHEFPLRNNPFVEDIGRSARRFLVEGYVIGDDYLVQKDALLTALESEGPGELVLPYYEIKRAIAGAVSTRETRSDGGIAVIAIEFVETPAQSLTPTEVVDSAEQVAATADAAVTATESEFAERYNPSGLPAFAVASATEALTKATEAIGATLGPVVKLAPIADTTQEFAELRGSVEAITSNASSLIREPADVLGQFRATITRCVLAIRAAPGAVATALVEAYGADQGAAAPETTATRRRERANQLAITGALRRVMAIEAARLVPLATYDSIEAATAARDQVAGLLEEQAAGAGDTAYPALVTLRSDLLRAVPGSAVFPRVVTVTRNVPVPSLVLAYQLYGSVDQEADIIARNRIRNPAFVAGDLKVLSNA
jgi:prophage DNA circulation protein